MIAGIFRYHFEDRVASEDVEDTLVLALLAAQALHGEAEVRLDAAHHFDRQRRACVIDATTPVGRSLNKLFTTFLRREFGEQAFRVERVGAVAAQHAGVT